MASTPQAPLFEPIEPALSEAASLLADTLAALLPKPDGPEAPLLQAMRDAALQPDTRRLHAFLVLQSGRLFGVDSRPLVRVAAAVACIDAAAGVHGGALLEGDEVASAVLSGDGLLTFAFSLLGSGDGIGDPYIRAELMTKLAERAGHGGLVGGLMLETVFARGTDAAPPPLPEISRLQRMRTAALTMFCCEAGAMLGRASPPARHALSAYGQDLGLAFQIAADLGAAPSGSQVRPTVVSALGPERARAQAAALSAQAVRHLDLFDEKADLLRSAAQVAKRMTSVATA